MACEQVDGFMQMYCKLKQNILLNGYSQSTLVNYARCISKISLHFNALPWVIDEEKINEYLLLVKEKEGRSMSYFKHTVYGLRYLFRSMGHESTILKAPRIKRTFNLPMVLSKEECKQLFKTPQNSKNKLLLMLAYGCGLRIREVVNIRVTDVYFDRRQLHIRQSKCWKDRYVTLPELLIVKLKEHVYNKEPNEFLFKGNAANGGMSTSGVQWVMREIVRKSGLTKQPSLHTLRHSFATHAIEDGQNLFRIKEQLGHENIETTMRYLHVARVYDPKQFTSPFDTLFLVK